VLVEGQITVDGLPCDGFSPMQVRVLMDGNPIDGTDQATPPGGFSYVTIPFSRVITAAGPHLFVMQVAYAGATPALAVYTRSLSAIDLGAAPPAP